MRNTLFRQTLSIIFSLVLLLFCSAVYAENIDPSDDDFQYAYGENVGWLNAEPSGDGGPGVEVTDSALTGYIWGENIGWINLSPNYGGVSNDAIGNLSDYAWSENVGWINFAPVNAGVTIDPATGEFSGFAWGENIGWINFAPNEVPVKTSWSGVVDNDGDGYLSNVDCDDTASSINPGATEVCNGTDDNCDGAIDEGFDTDGDNIANCFDNCPTIPAQELLLMDYNGDYLLSIDEVGTATAALSAAVTNQNGQPLGEVPVIFNIVGSNEVVMDTCSGFTNESGVVSCNLSDLPPDVYTVLAESSEAGCPAASTEAVLVVFVPNVPRATGGGFILPDEESTLPAETNAEKANFGFIVQIDKNQVAAGNLEFQYKAADINLKSQSMAWYTVSNNKAMFQGQGTINGEAIYTFRVHATDGDLTGDQIDAFEITIWVGADTEADPFHRAKNDLAGGSIVIHKK